MVKLYCSLRCAHKFMGTSKDGDEYAEIIRMTTSPHFAYLLGTMSGKFMLMSNFLIFFNTKLQAALQDIELD